MEAAYEGTVDCLEILVQAGADLEAKNNVRVEFDGHVYSVGIEGGREGGREATGCKGGVRVERVSGVRVGWVERGGQIHSNFGTIKFIKILP